MKTVNEQRAEMIEQFAADILKARQMINDAANNCVYVVQNKGLSGSGMAIEYDANYGNPRASCLSKCTYFASRERAEVVARNTLDGANMPHRAINLKVALLRFISEQQRLIAALKAAS